MVLSDALKRSSTFAQKSNLITSCQKIWREGVRDGDAEWSTKIQ